MQNLKIQKSSPFILLPPLCLKQSCFYCSPQAEEAKLGKLNPSRLGMEMSPVSQYSTISPVLSLIVLKIETEERRHRTALFLLPTSVRN